MIITLFYKQHLPITISKYYFIIEKKHGRRFRENNFIFISNITT